jgi:hypothetical protein
MAISVVKKAAETFGPAVGPTQTDFSYDWHTHFYPHSDCCCGLSEELAQNPHAASLTLGRRLRLGAVKQVHLKPDAAAQRILCCGGSLC